MRQVARQAKTEPQVLFLPGVFNETLGLLFEAHQYFETRGQLEQIGIAAEKRMTYAHEMSRVTTRLTSVMAWLMVRRAIHYGEMDASAADLYHLDGEDVCLEHHPTLLAGLPYYLMYLSERSLSLYERVHRLDTLDPTVH